MLNKLVKRTPLYNTHSKAGARMVSFGGWEMPIQYAGILEESRSVRSRVGIFDVSHMGRLDISGNDSTVVLDSVFSSSVYRLQVGRAKYGVICNLQGGIIDDCILYRQEDARYLLIPNAANTSVVLDWLIQHIPAGSAISVENKTTNLGMVSIQGPDAVDILSSDVQTDLKLIKPFHHITTQIQGFPGFIARTGYTGEDGFEIILPRDRIVALWQRLVDLGTVPVGLGARDVLRLEASLPLHGNDIDENTNPYQARLDKFVDPDREGYVAGEALRRIRDEGTSRILVGFRMMGRGIARQGHRILDGKTEVGLVTSGSVSPTLDTNIGMGYVPHGFSTPGTRLIIDIRGRPVEAQVEAPPFYNRRRK